MSGEFKEISSFPLSWPAGWKRAQSRKRSNFGSHISFERARVELYNELKLMGTRDWNVILSSNLPLRRDGHPYSGMANPQDPGVAIYFRYKEKPMVFACDSYISVIDNIWAIRKTIEALRGIQRWGASDMMERAFTGFQALPPAPKNWREILQVPESKDLGVIKSHYKNLCRIHHPDVGGDPAQMAKINKAWEEAEKELG